MFTLKMQKLCPRAFDVATVSLDTQLTSLLHCLDYPSRAVTKALIGGGGGYSYIRIPPDEFLLKSVVITVDFKRNSSAEREYMNMHPPPPN